MKILPQYRRCRIRDQYSRLEAVEVVEVAEVVLSARVNRPLHPRSRIPTQCRAASRRISTLLSWVYEAATNIESNSTAQPIPITVEGISSS